MSVTINGTSGVTFNDASNQTTAATGFGFKNRILNGQMVIDQRNAGASVSITPSTAYAVDRFNVGIAQGSGSTSQRSTSAPAGFINSLLVTVGTGASPAAGSVSRVFQNIEGLNIADFDWGLATASTITLSFWVKSSLTGTFAGGIYNSATNRTYVFTYAISAANTWEQKSVTIAGDTSGTWLTTNGIGMTVNWDLGTGSTYQGTAGVWAAGAAWATSGSVKLAATSGATWSVTGVQLEKGSTATSFDYRPYSTELQLAQRYYYRVISQVGFGRFGSSFNSSTTTGVAIVPFPVSMRTNPLAIEQSGTAADYAVVHGITSTVCSAVPVFNSGTNSNNGAVTFTVASGLTAGQGSQFTSASGVTTAYLGWSAEL